MNVLQAGVPKSGNLWLYQILESVWAEAGLERRRFITGHPIYQKARTWPLSYPEQASVDVLDFERGRTFCRISSRFREEVEDLAGYCARASHVWTHAAITGADLPQLGGFDRIVYILRDPRDVAISMARFAFTPYMQHHYPHRSRSPEDYLQRHLTKLAKYWVQHVGSWLRHRGNLPLAFVCYERLLADLPGELEHLLAFLGVELDAAARQRVQAAVSFDAMRTTRPNHLHAGRSGGWRETLSPAQIAKLGAVAAPMLRLFDYPLDAASEAGLPAVPPRIDPAALVAATTPAHYTAAERWRDRAGQARGRLSNALARLGTRS
jgi:aryl sulfotransferase